MTRTLAIDIGGTKYARAVFEDDRIVIRDSHATHREGGREWMMERIVSTGRQWLRAGGFARCGIGFGGPVIFAGARMARNTNVSSPALYVPWTTSLGMWAVCPAVRICWS